ncbi:tryptophan synthase subunit alpha [Gammaproteobacteria bacterium SCGC AG-212-F23]|nr:tryptophan synthase subunit alpha [Gammaproteobacteria bacterium SCGC AG-212-F23]
MQRIQNRFKQEKVFVAYLTAGDGGMQRTLDAALALIAGGVNMLEIGVPFSDPVADGPVIQRAAKRALAAKTTLQDILQLTKEIRKKSDIPLILFSYLNPIFSVFNTTFFQEAAAAGIDGALLVDCPLEESNVFQQKCLENHIAPIYVITPSTPMERVRKIAQHGKGFLYYACRKGTTGVRTDLPSDFTEKMQSIQANVNLPVITGFGISSRDAATKVLQYADGVVVGSLFVKALEDGITPTELTTLAASINPLVRKKV